MVHIGNDWDKLLEQEFKKDYYQQLRKFLAHEYKTQTVFPDMYDIFNAFKLTSYNDTKVVIFGQDPYHEPNQAHGLAFSVCEGVRIPPSLVNIYKELNREFGCYIPDNGNLTYWAEQGVMLLNNSLTVRSGLANSHRNKGWEIFTDAVARIYNEREKPIVFLLWGNNAKEKLKIITNPNHIILTSVHPSPLSASRGFFGCDHFKKTNEILTKLGYDAIDWQIKNVKNG